jgi:hypothetical protein
VVVVAVAEHDRIEAAHAQRLQRRHHDIVTGVVAVGTGGTGVVQQGMRTRANQHGEPLPDVDHRRDRVAA